MVKRVSNLYFKLFEKFNSGINRENITNNQNPFIIHSLHTRTYTKE